MIKFWGPVMAFYDTPFGPCSVLSCQDHRRWPCVRDAFNDGPGVEGEKVTRCWSQSAGEAQT